MIRIDDTESGIRILQVTVSSLDAANHESFRAGLKEVLKPGAQHVLDLSLVDFMDSAGLGVLLSILRQVTSEEGDLALSGLSPQVRYLLEIVRMHKIVDIYNDLGEALSSWTH